MRQHTGFTILELLIAMAILAIATTMAAPSFQAVIKETRARAQARSVVEAMELARSNAVTRRRPITFCASTNSSTCAASTSAWGSGWVVRDTVDNSILQVGSALEGGSTLTSAAHTITFDAFGEIGASTQLTLRPSGCAGTDARLIDVVTTGLVNVQKTAC